VFTRALHLSLSWATSIQSISSHPISLRSILILSTHLRLGRPSGLFPYGFPTNILHANLTCLPSCSLARIYTLQYQRFRGTRFLHLHLENGGSSFFRDITCISVKSFCTISQKITLLVLLYMSAKRFLKDK
jgi:hypothetical protein